MSASRRQRRLGGAGLAGVAATYLPPGFESPLAPFFALPAGLAEARFLLWMRGMGARSDPDVIEECRRGRPDSGRPRRFSTGRG